MRTVIAISFETNTSHRRKELLICFYTAAPHALVPMSRHGSSSDRAAQYARQ